MLENKWSKYKLVQAYCTASSIAQWYSAGFKCGRSRVQSPVKDRLLDSLVVQCCHRVREVPYSIPSQRPPPRQPSGRMLASSAGGPVFNPQSRTASSIAQWQSAGIECGRSRVQSPVKDRVITKTFYKWYQQLPCLALNIKKGNTGSF